MITPSADYGDNVGYADDAFVHLVVDTVVRVVAGGGVVGDDALQHYHCDDVNDDTQPRPVGGGDVPQPLEHGCGISQPVLREHKPGEKHSLSLIKADPMLLLLKTIFA